jgi:hypothetical protein
VPETTVPGTATGQTYRCHLSVLAALVITLFAAVFSDGAPTAAAATPILGDTNLEAPSDSNLAGQAEAFRTTASQTAQASTLNVYVSSRSSTATLQAGIYANGSGHPAVLLGAGSAHASPGGWSAVTLGSPVSLKAGSVYWIAVLGPAGGGTLAFRDQQNRSVTSETAAQTSLSSLPDRGRPATPTRTVRSRPTGPGLRFRRLRLTCCSQASRSPS